MMDYELHYSKICESLNEHINARYICTSRYILLVSLVLEFEAPEPKLLIYRSWQRWQRPRVLAVLKGWTLKGEDVLHCCVPLRACLGTALLQ